MDRTQKIFDIIRFTADKTLYYGASIEMPKILLDTGHYTKHTEVYIPLGHSRYGGPIVDLPPGIEYPNGLHFAAQLDLSKFAPFDKSGLLPKSGQLLFFANKLQPTFGLLLCWRTDQQWHLNQLQLISGRLRIRLQLPGTEFPTQQQAVNVVCI
jgi:hypothetical protein